MGKKEIEKGKRNSIIIIVVFVLIWILSAILGPSIASQVEDLLYFKDYLYYTEDTEPDSIGDWIELWKYMKNNDEYMTNGEAKYQTVYETDVEKFTNPVWDYLLERNQDLNDNYRAQFNVKDPLYGATFNIDVDGNIAKVVLNLYVNEEDENYNIKKVFEKQYEYYMVLENNIVASYYQDDSGKWLRTMRTPITEGCVAFDLEGMVKKLSELDPFNPPVNSEGWNYPETVEKYGSISMSSKLLNHTGELGEDGFVDARNVIFSSFTYHPKYDKKMTELLRNPLYISDFVNDEMNWAGKDAFLDWLCENDEKIMLAGISLRDYGNVKVELPEGIESAEMVDDFQFMTEDIKEVLVAQFNNAE